MDRRNQKLLTMMRVAKEVSTLATCPRSSSGAVIVNEDFSVLSTGYNGAPSGLRHCSEVGCLLMDNHCVRVLHAEENAVLNANKQGIGLKGSTLICTHFPCPHCSLMIVQVGIHSVQYLDEVPSYDEGHRKVVRDFFYCSGVSLGRVKLDDLTGVP